MKKYLFLIMVVFSLFLIPFVSSELNLWNSVIKDNSTSIVTHHMFYVLEDTSIKGVGTNKEVPVVLNYVIQALPYNLTYGNVDYCNLTIDHYKNDYDGEGNYINTSIVTQSLYFTSIPTTSGFLTFNLKSRDNLLGGVSCHYTDVNSLYQDNVLVGKIGTYVPSFECDECSTYSLEELSNQIENNEQIANKEIAIYQRVHTFFSWNMMIWLILSWIIKIVFIGIALTLIFACVYYFYKYLKSLERTI